MRHRATIYIFLMISLTMVTAILSCGTKNIDCLRVDSTTFQQEVLESQVPVLVVFCSDDLWNRDRIRYSHEYQSITQPAPVILAVKQIIQSGQYEYVIKFCRYYEASRSDPICVEYDIKWFPTTAVFKDGSVFWKDEGAGCLVPDTGEKIEGTLKEAIDEN